MRWLQSERRGGSLRMKPALHSIVINNAKPCACQMTTHPGKFRLAHEPFAAPAGPIRNAQVLAKEYDHAGGNLSGATGDRPARSRAQGAAELERGPLRPLRVAARERARRGARLRRPVPRPGPAP